ncbi:hypothetical protein Lal_00044775 [Lupinus albus]|nr:hypothetical protein Lal_00044775 [Lupinus albus]
MPFLAQPRQLSLRRESSSIAQDFTLPTSFTNTTNIYAQTNDISLLDGTNFDVSKEVIEIILACIDLDLTLCMEKSIYTPGNLDEAKIDK